MSSTHLKPAPLPPGSSAAGRIVRAPDGTIIPPEGAHLMLDLYLQRRIADGDLVVVSPAGPSAREAQSEGNRKKGSDA
jgi:hypothetical protein